MSGRAVFLSSRLCFLLYLLHASRLAFADRNITVDDNDSSIKYSTDWSVSSGSNPLDYGGFHHLAESKSAIATFTFTGTAVYIMCPLWPYAVGAQASVDRSSPVSVDMQDHSHTTDGGSETVASAVLWGMNNLANTSHTLTISLGTTQQYAALDAIVYTVPDNSLLVETTSTLAPSSTVSSSLSESSSAAARESSNAAKPSINNTIVIAAAVGGGVFLAIIGIAVAVCLVRRQRQGAKPRYQMVEDSGADMFVAGRGSRSYKGKSYSNALPDSPTIKSLSLGSTGSHMSYYSDTSYSGTIEPRPSQNALQIDNGSSYLSHGSSSSHGEGSQYYGQPISGSSSTISPYSAGYGDSSTAGTSSSAAVAEALAYAGEVTLSYGRGNPSGSGEGSSSGRPRATDIYITKPYGGSEEKRKLAEASRPAAQEPEAPPSYSD
ncbi:hypothetical protein D9757_007123 [Collybiopsis confluens]|uniref:Mid2 domain-containing protein n=1 Tax=Collybiopsis confluens TaxID=2823264 RepID=A0A8H5HCF3_9AGAR|nr:hypothetical protein D9757_007123 [Collybiopsis confluens]